jgi:L-threonylcarbamoyladenylate synthase
MVAQVIPAAVAILRRGGLVAFPTETVYGLGANAADPLAVRRIFAAKGRPASNPLIVHVATATIAKRYAIDWPAAADALAAAFWPGPLTIVLPRDATIADEVSAGRGTVGLRVPDHTLALQLLAAFDGPLAAPSANRANHVSPTTAEHVRDELGDRVDLILDGGPCAVGIESTVVDLTGLRPALLRPGSISRDQLQAVVGPVDVVHGSAASPGQGSRHYAPVTPAYRFERGEAVPPGAVVLTCDTDPAAYARTLYARLRQLDRTAGASAIYVELPPDVPVWSAVRDRLLRATLPAGQ